MHYKLEDKNSKLLFIKFSWNRSSVFLSLPLSISDFHLVLLGMSLLFVYLAKICILLDTFRLKVAYRDVNI